MADKKLKFIIEGVDNASPAMGKVQNSSEKMGKGVSRFGGMAKAGLLAVGAGAAAAATAAVKMAGDFEKSMANVSTLIDTGVESMDGMKKEVLDISKRTPVALGDLTESLYNVRSAGIAAEDAMMVLEKSAQLGVTGLGSTAEAVDLATSAINAFNFEGEEAAEVFDLIQLTVKSGKTTISELAQSFGNVAGVAKTAGVSFKELQAATAAMTTSGQKASVAQNALRQAILSIQAPTSQMADLVSDLGFESGESMVRQLGLVESMRQLNDASGGSADVMKKAFGSVEALGAALSLTGEQADEFDSIMMGMNDSAGTLEEAFAKQSETFEAQSQILKNNLNAVMIQLGNVILPLVNSAIQAIIPVVERVSQWFTNFSENGLESGTMMAEVADIAKNYLLPIIVSVFDMIKAASEAWSMVWNNDMLGMQDITKEVMGIVFDIIKGVLTMVGGLFKATAALMRGEWGQAMDYLGEAGMGAYEENKGWIEALADFLSDILLSITQGIKGFISGILTAIDAFGAAFSAKWKALWEGAKTMFTNIWTSILKSLENMLNKAVELINKVIRSMNKVPGVSIPLVPKVSLVDSGESEAASAAGAVGMRASGGSVTAGTPYVVGERGAETFVPNQSGTIVPAGQGGSVTINITGNTFDSRERIQEMAEAVEERLSRAMQLQRFGATI